jgi:hypothetical protein
MNAIAHTPIEWGKINFPKKSSGHIIFKNGFEYFHYDRNVYRAARNDPIEYQGFRNGRFYCTMCSWMQSPIKGDDE